MEIILIPIYALAIKDYQKWLQNESISLHEIPKLGNSKHPHQKL